MSEIEPGATEHADGVGANPPCDTCGAPTELVMLERFTGWWCRSCATPAAASGV